MNKFHIYFFGLICHLGKSRTRKKRAAIVRDDDHFPVILFDRHDWLPLRSAKRVKLQRLDEGDTPTDPLFRQYVPSVRTILGGTLPADVDGGTAEDKAIFVKYPAGTLHVVDLYADGARYFVDEDDEIWSGPVARITGINASTSHQKVVVRLEGFEISPGNEITIEREVPSNSCILFANISNDVLAEFPEFTSTLSAQTKATSLEAHHHDMQKDGLRGAGATVVADNHPHILHYGHILDNEQPVSYEKIPIEPETVTPPQCDWVKNFVLELVEAKIFSSVNPECGNTDYP